jgi:hypothetical protein
MVPLEFVIDYIAYGQIWLYLLTPNLATSMLKFCLRSYEPLQTNIFVYLASKLG